MSKGGPGVEPRDASTVMVVREGAGDELEVFCVERHPRSGFLGGALVFPGGKVDSGDRVEAWARLSTPLCPRARSFAADEATARAFAVAALREALEEAGIVAVTGARLDTRALVALRRDISGETPVSFAAALGSRGLLLDTARLAAVGRWITPTDEPKRFDTRFYLLSVPDGQEGAHDNHETTTSFWATPSDVLCRWQREEVVLAPPTVWMLGLFSGLKSTESAFAVAERTSLEPVLPCFVEHAGTTVLTLPGDPLHPVFAAPPDDPDAPTRFVLHGRRFLPERGH
jgi:8-oxo-dGTP pyrophosphatase MutT (NUDIX family)